MKRSIKDRIRAYHRSRLQVEQLEARRVLAYQDVILADNPIAYFRMEETTQGILTDSAPLGGTTLADSYFDAIPGRPGALAQGGTALGFTPNGPNGFSAATMYNYPMTRSFTAELWARSNTPTWNDFGWLMSEGAPNGFRIFPFGGTTAWQAYIVDGVGNNLFIGGFDPGVPITGWHHYAISYDGVNDIGSMYFDGRLVVSTPQLGGTNRAAVANLSYIDMGAWDLDEAFAPGDGDIDEVALYQSVLSPQQIRRHYEAGAKVDVIWDGGAGDFNWNNPVNWVGDNNIPDTPNDTAIFRNTGVGTVSLSGMSRTIDSIRFENTTGSYNFIASGNLATNSIIQTGNASNSIATPLQLTGSLINTAAGTLTVSSNVSTGSDTLTIDGAGTTNLNGNVTSVASGRFIRVTNLGINDVTRWLHLSEVEAFAPGVVPGAAIVTNATNFAFQGNGATFEAFTGNFNHGALGNQSPINGAAEGGINTYTLGQSKDNSYTIDLGQVRDIGSVRLWQRNDGCCQDRLSAFKVEVLGNNNGVAGSLVAERTFSDQVPTNGNTTLTFGATTKVVKRGTGTLVLAGNNTYTGGTEIHNGELRVANTAGSATGSGPVRVGAVAPQVRFIDFKDFGSAHRMMHIGEIEAFPVGVTPAAGVLDNANNVALSSKGGTVENYSGDFLNGLGHGIAGSVLNGALETGANIWTRNGLGVNMTVDLGRGMDIGSLRVWQRVDGCCQDRLSNFRVEVLADDGFGRPGATLAAGNLQPFQVATNGSVQLNLPTFATPATFGRITGSGTIAGAVTVMPGNTLSPGVGVGSAGVIRTGSLDLRAGSNVDFFAGALGNDSAIVTGSVNIAGALATLATQAGYRPTHLQALALINNDGADGVTGTFSGIVDNQMFTFNGRTYMFSYNYDLATSTDGGGNDVVLIHIDRAPNTPTITSAPQSTSEGGADVTFTATGTDPDGDAVSFAWDINGDGIYTDAAGASVTLSWAQLVALGVNDGPASHNVRVRASDSELTADSAAQTLSITNTAPTALVSGPIEAVPGQSLAFLFSANDPSPADTGMTYVINWGDGPTVNVPGPAAGTVISHTYMTLGMKTITVQARDKDNGLSAPVTHQVNIVPVLVDANGDLQVGGTDGADRIIISISGGVMVRMNNKLYGPFSVPGELFIMGNNGNDTITMSTNVFIPATVLGGEGNDYVTGGPAGDTLLGEGGNDRLLGSNGDDTIDGGTGADTLSGGAHNDIMTGDDGNDTINGDVGDDWIDGGAGNDKTAGGAGNDILRGGEGADTVDGGAGDDILLGEAGGDKVYGREGHDLVIGGEAFDTLYGGAGEDLVIGGETVHDTDDAMLMAVLAEWTGGGTLQSRIDSLTAGLLTDSDLSSSSTNLFYGENGNDWLIAILGDGLKDKKSGDALRLL